MQHATWNLSVSIIKKPKKCLWNHLWACLPKDHNKNQSKRDNNSTYYINSNKNSFRKNLGYKVHCLPTVVIFNLSTLENYLIDRNWLSNLFLNSKTRFRNSFNVPSTITRNCCYVWSNAVSVKVCLNGEKLSGVQGLSSPQSLIERLYEKNCPCSLSQK